VLGGMFVEADGSPSPERRGGHFVLPRSDYQIVDGSWSVSGLKGTGSKDLVVEDAFIPGYRTVDEGELFTGELARRAANPAPLYRVPWMTLFPAAITASVVGMAFGALDGTLAYQRSRVTVFGSQASQDPHVMAAIGEAASEIDASRLQLLDNVRHVFEACQEGHEVPLQAQARARRDQVRAAWRSARAVDTLFASSGGNAIRLDKPVQRFWRDIHAGLNHAVHISGPVYQAFTGVTMGVELTGSAANVL
jgi:alkylation response protein AidB-like acyl-CoA dehydrogenase